ncbi:MAG: hypothetical protein GY765_16700, partial [bacterium]|nr:hypothetical protein [bacterium]
ENYPVWITAFANRLSYHLEDFEHEDIKWYMERLNINMRQLESLIIMSHEELQQYLSVF